MVDRAAMIQEIAEMGFDRVKVEQVL